MKKTSVRILITTGVVFIAFGIVGYMLLFPLTETPQQNQPELAQVPQRSDPDISQVDQDRPAKSAKSEIPRNTAPKKKTETKNSPDTGSANQSNEKYLLSAGRSALGNPDGRERAMAASRLRNANSEEAVDLLCKFLDDDDNLVIFHALNSLTLLGTKNSDLKGKVYGILLEKARDKNCPERGNALIFASKVGNDEKILDVISNYIDEYDEDETGKRFAAKALAGIADPKSIDYLQKIMIRPHPRKSIIVRSTPYP